MVALSMLSILTVLVGGWAVGYWWWMRPAVSIEHEGTRVVVHTELLGEYPSEVARVEVIDANSARTLWTGLPEGDEVQIHSLTLRAGMNDSRPDVFWGRFRAPAAGETPTFRLEPSTAYIVKVCAPAIIPLCQSKSFAFDRTPS